MQPQRKCTSSADARARARGWIYFNFIQLSRQIVLCDLFYCPNRRRGLQRGLIIIKCSHSLAPCAGMEPPLDWALHACVRKFSAKVLRGTHVCRFRCAFHVLGKRAENNAAHCFPQFQSFAPIWVIKFFKLNTAAWLHATQCSKTSIFMWTAVWTGLT